LKSAIPAFGNAKVADVEAPNGFGAIELVVSEGLLDLIGRDRKVGPCANPRLDLLAQSRAVQALFLPNDL
jgi:hypothetical protein